MFEMKVLLDENCSKLKQILLEIGWDVVTVKEVIDRKAGYNSVSDEQIINYAKEKKAIIVIKDNGIKFRCFNESIPFIDIGSPEQEAKIVDRKLMEMQAWKEYL